MISARETRIWIAAFLGVAVLIAVTGFKSDDPDSALYAQLSARLSIEPISKWIAPEWWGFWPEAGMTGLFREHPAGVFWLPAALGRVGVPPAQAAYIVGVAAALGAVLLIGSIVTRLTTRADGRAILVLLQLMPAAFIFRVRANHEYPMLFALALTLAGLSGVARSWRWAPLVAAGFTVGLLVKGVFVVMPFAAAGLWILINPTAEAGMRRRGIVAVAAGIAVMAGAAALYDWQYARVTGETFWGAYWQRQLGPLNIATPVEGGATILQHIGFYIGRLMWHPAPWSFAILGAAWAWRRRARDVWTRSPVATRRGLLFAFGFTAAVILILAPASRYAERYAFSATYAIGAAGAVIAYRHWTRLAEMFRRADEAIPAFPALVWFGLMMLRLAVGPVLPRI